MWGFYLQSLWDSVPFFFRGLWVTVQVAGLSLAVGTVTVSVLRVNDPPVSLDHLMASISVTRTAPWPRSAVPNANHASARSSKYSAALAGLQVLS